MFLLIRAYWSFRCDVIVCIEFVNIHWLMVSYSMSILLRKRLTLLNEVKVFVSFFFQVANKLLVSLKFYENRRHGFGVDHLCVHASILDL